jgi:hypothetical protein
VQLANPSAFGDLVTGGPLMGANYTWVIRSNLLFQFIASYMVNKPQDAESDQLGVTQVIQSNPSGSITASLTTIAQEGGFGVVTDDNRSMLYLYPSVTFTVDKWGTHDFKAGSELYPFLRRDVRTDISPLELYFRPPGTTGQADLLFERDTFRSLAGTGSETFNKAWENIWSFYFQDRWKPTSNISIKAGFRVDSNRIYTQDRKKVLAPLLPAGFPTKTDDKEFDQTTFAPNFGIAYDAGRLGVFRGTAGRYYEWLDLGGGDGTSHFPYVAATDVARANPRSLAPTLNQILPGAFPLGVNYGEGNVKTYTNEFSVGWEKRLPATSSVGVTFLLKRTWDFQGSDDMNVIRDPQTGAFLGRPFPDYNAVNRTYAPNYSIQQFRSIQFLYTKNFAGGWGVNANYWYGIHQRIQRKFNPTSDTLQYKGFTTDELTDDWLSPRHQARFSAFARLPFDFSVSGFYSITQGPRTDVLTGDFPLNATAPTVVLSNGRAVSDPFFNPAYPRGGRRGVDMLNADTVHLVNLRIEKTFRFAANRRLELSSDVFNLFNTDAAFGFLSADARSANFAKKTNTVPARVAQVGVRFVF